MRTVTIILDSAFGHSVREIIPATEVPEFISNGGLTMLNERLDILERDGPWKPEVQNSLRTK